MSYAITADNYFDKSQPAKTEELANVVKVAVSPLSPASIAEEVYRSDAAVTIGAGASVSLTVQYDSSKVPVIAAVASLEDQGAGVSISSATYYAWGALVTVANTGGASSFVLVIDGKPLTVQGETIITSEDADSILEYGRQEYALPECHLVQSRAIGQTIADALLTSYKTHRRDVTVNWRGNPALELRDEITVPEYDKGGITTTGTFYKIREQLQYDGTLRAVLDGRKIETTTTTAGA